MSQDRIVYNLGAERAENLTAEIVRLMDVITQNEHWIERAKKDLEKAPSWAYVLAQISGEEHNAIPNIDRTRQTIEQWANDQEQTFAEQTQRINDRNSIITSYRTRIAQLQVELAQAKANCVERVIMLEDVKKALAHNPHVHNVWMEDSCLFVVFKDLVMRPSKNDFLCINNGAIPSIRLPQIRLQLSFPSMACDFQYNGGIGTIFPPRYYNGVHSVHPHVLSEGEPCLGDFGGPYTELMEAGEVVGAIEVLQLFLQQADATDQAGELWYRAVVALIQEQYGTTNTTMYRNYIAVYDEDAGEWNEITVQIGENGELTIEDYYGGTQSELVEAVRGESEDEEREDDEEYVEEDY